MEEIQTDLTYLTHNFAEFQMFLTQQVADEVTRIHKKLEDSLRGKITFSLVENVPTAVGAA